MNTDNELVTVIITTYRATGRLSEAIDSVINQSYSNYEVIVVDDNLPNSESRKYTEKIMEKYNSNSKIIYIKHDYNKNGAAARNTGIRAAHGSFIAFLDDDDIYYPKRLEKCVNALVGNPEYGAVYSSVDIYKKNEYLDTRKATENGCIWKKLLLNEGLLGTGSNLFLKQSVVKKVGFFDERFLRYQDVEYMLRVTEKEKILSIPEALVRKNIEDTNIPPYIKYKKNKSLIFLKFSYLINQLDEKEKNNFFNNHYNTLYKSALDSLNKKYIKDSIKNLEEINTKLPLKYYVKAKIPHIYKMYSSFLRRIRKFLAI